MTEAATIFDLCEPRPDVLAGTATDADFAADLSHVIRGAGGPAEYADPARFFANTYPTRGLKNLLANVCARLGGRGAAAASFRLDTSFGGGKTHGLIALVHAARDMRGVADPGEFVDPALLPAEEVRVAAFDGENADPANGRRMGEGVLAFTPWGEIAYALAGREGYERVRRSDEDRVAPGAGTLAELFAGGPALVLLDELAVYLRKVAGRPGARDQLTAFLTVLFKAVETSPRAALVYTLALGKDGRAGDAYGSENQFVAGRMAEAESVSARKATLLNPTEDDETAQVLRRRLFGRVDEAAAGRVVEEYRRLWHEHRGALAPAAARPDTAAGFLASYPLHPDLLDTFTGKAATLELPARPGHAAHPRAHGGAAVGAAARRRDRDPPPPRRPRLRAGAAGDRDPPRPGHVRPGDPQRRRRGAGEAVAGAGDRRRAPPRPASLRRLRRPGDADALARVQRAAQGPDRRPSASRSWSS